MPGFDMLEAPRELKESLVRMQFNAQTASYRGMYPDALFAVIEHDGQAIGRMVIHEADGVADLVDMALLPAVRGRGVGSAFLAALTEWLGARCTTIQCKVLSGNFASFRMLEKAGYMPDGGTPPHVTMVWRRSGAAA